MTTEVRFGNYVLEERIAAGGMAEVFRARRVGVAGFSRRVCIKRILPGLCNEQSFVNMFIDEARTGAQLRHGNIVAIDDFGEVDGQYFLCMEFVSGTDLWHLSRRLAADGRVLPLDVVFHVGAEVLRALDYAHRKLGSDGAPLDIVHRDVSPHNVLLSRAGEAKLSDFGIAKARSRLHQTVGHVVKGKLGYMPPEQARGEALDGRADVFSLGVVVYEALAGCRPFAGNNDAEMIMSLLRGERGDLARYRPDLPRECVAWVHRMVVPERAGRYETAHAALADLVVLSSGSDGVRTLTAMMAHYFPEGSATEARPASSFVSGNLPFAEGPTDPMGSPDLSGATVAYVNGSPPVSPPTPSPSREVSAKDATRTMHRAGAAPTGERRRVGVVVVAITILAACLIAAAMVGYALAR